MKNPQEVPVTEHAQPHATRVRSIAQWFDRNENALHQQFATELRAAAERLEQLEQERDELRLRLDELFSISEGAKP